jgi:hypothetical protein
MESNDGFGRDAVDPVCHRIGLHTGESVRVSRSEGGHRGVWIAACRLRLRHGVRGCRPWVVGGHGAGPPRGAAVRRRTRHHRHLSVTASRDSSIPQELSRRHRPGAQDALPQQRRLPAGQSPGGRRQSDLLQHPLLFLRRRRQSLRALGLSEAAAHRLLRDHGEDAVRAQLEFFPWPSMRSPPSRGWRPSSSSCGISASSFRLRSRPRLDAGLRLTTLAFGYLGLLAVVGWIDLAGLVRLPASVLVILALLGWLGCLVGRLPASPRRSLSRPRL